MLQVNNYGFWNNNRYFNRMVNLGKREIKKTTQLSGFLFSICDLII